MRILIFFFSMKHLFISRFLKFVNCLCRSSGMSMLVQMVGKITVCPNKLTMSMRGPQCCRQTGVIRRGLVCISRSPVRKYAGTVPAQFRRAGIGPVPAQLWHMLPALGRYRSDSGTFQHAYWARAADIDTLLSRWISK